LLFYIKLIFNYYTGWNPRKDKYGNINSMTILFLSNRSDRKNLNHYNFCDHYGLRGISYGEFELFHFANCYGLLLDTETKWEQVFPPTFILH
jgi:hypothetical protein